MTASKPNVAQIQTLRSIAFGSISGTYAEVGAPYTDPLLLFRIANNTNGDMIVSTDPTISAGQFFLPAGSFVLYDLRANSALTTQLSLQGNTQFYAKQSTAPSAGSLYIEGVA